MVVLWTMEGQTYIERENDIQIEGYFRRWDSSGTKEVEEECV